jgi:hypothetical protein
MPGAGSTGSALRSQARFPSVPVDAGHYESFYIKAADPARPRALWIRHTVHKRRGEAAVGSVWMTFFDGDGPGPVASKVTLAPEALSADGDRYIAVGDSVLGPAQAAGEARSDRCSAAWELSFDDGPPEAFQYLPRPWMYSAAIPRTKALSLYPATSFAGSLELDGRAIEIDSWTGMVGHNWGSEHAERWIWTHGSVFPGAPDARLDAIIGRVRVGPLTLPWIANGALWLGGELHRLGGPARIRATAIDEHPTRCSFKLPGGGVVVEGVVDAALKDVVAWRYSDPSGAPHDVTHCSIASMELTVTRQGAAPLALGEAKGATYELGMREQDHGIPLAPFPDP